MEILPSTRILHTFFLILLEFSFTSQDEFYINCGSSSSITLGRRNFVGDANSGANFTLTASRTTIATNPSPGSDSSSTSLYSSARVFKSESWYEFGIVQNGTYILRLHFFPFTSQDYNLFDAKFNVSASGVSGISLLSEFSIGSSSNLPLVEEFLLTIINPGKFRINFLPFRSSMAFINAIEVNVTPSNPMSFIPDSAPHITLLENNNNIQTFNGLLSNALHVIHRINVGGTEVNPDDDTLSRQWVPDDEYLISPPRAAENFTYGIRQINYMDGFATRYDAPDSVYTAAKVMNTSSRMNVTWNFNITKSDKLLVRVHFCDIVSQTSTTTMKFNLFIYGGYRKQIDPRAGDRILTTAVPFYYDFVVDSDDSSFMNISIGEPVAESNALLNGLEIMKLIPNGAIYTIQNRRSNYKIVIIIIASIIGAVLIVGIISMAVFLFTRRKKKTKSVENFERPPISPFLSGSSHSKKTSTQRNNECSPLHDLDLGLKLPLADILLATNNFDDKLIIGKGGFGKVYKGTLKKNGTKVAVKRCDLGGRQGLPEFQTEIMVLSRIRHRHLVSLIGYCDDRSEMVLVYEFMEKGTLREHLYNCKEGRGGLSWEKRLQLCIDAAHGLHYLHSGLNGSVIHRDIKSTNILLDEHYVAKVADFGISRTGVLDDQSHVTTEVKGTFGYLDPEYYRIIQLTQKSDVFSFGVVLLEVLCARAAIDTSLPSDQVNLAEWGTSCIQKGELNKLIDPFLVGKINPNSLRKFTETVEKCLKEYGVDRPPMVDVLWDLEYALQLQKNDGVLSRQELEFTETDVSFDSRMLPGINSLPISCQDSIISMINSQEKKEDIINMRSLSGSVCSDTSEVFSQLRVDKQS